jgi:uncharacterized protein (TIGR00251 family)
VRTKGDKFQSVILDVHVLPRSPANEILGVKDGRLRVRITSPPEGGKANEQLIKLLAHEIGIRKDQVEIVSGSKSRIKRILLKNISNQELSILLPHQQEKNHKMTEI